LRDNELSGTTDPDLTIDVVIEIPRGSRNKYEFDEELGAIRLDRVLFSSVHYPTDYGYIPDTHAPDGDHLDVLVIVEEPTFPGCHILVRPIGMLEMRDEKGLDHKVIAVPVADPRLSHLRDLSELAPHWLREIENFFATYKTLEDKATEIAGWADAAQAIKTIHEFRDEPTQAG
jgi:inorganic pyrophosphatase